MKLVYLAQPIDQAGRSWTWADLVAESLSALAGTVVYRPIRAFTLSDPSQPDPRLEEINRAALERADALVAVVPEGVPTVGTPREIEFANSAGIPWAVMTDITTSFSLLDAPFTVTLDVNGVDGLTAWVGALTETGFGLQPVGDLQFAKVADTGDGHLPTRAHPGDAGYDLYVSEEVTIPAGGFRDVPCGVRTALPEGVWGWVVGRSSTLRQRRLLVAGGVIDTGYRGPLFAGVENLGEVSVTVKPGERLAQLILMPNVSAMFAAKWVSATEYDAIPHDGRGVAGFGSSGG